MRSLILLGLLAAGACMAQPANVAPWLTGARLLTMLTYPPGKGTFDLTPEQYADKENARFYIDAVHDATEGKAWCYSERYRLGPLVLHEDVVIGLRALPPAQLQRNAAELVTEIWRKKWPCQDGRTPRK